VLSTRALTLGLLALPALITGCGSDCDDIARLDGSWVVSSWVGGDDWQVSGFDTTSADVETAQQAAIDQASLLSQVFANGESQWELARKGDGDTFTLSIDNQAYDARMIEQKGACNALDLTFQGAWTGADSSIHTFKFVGEVTFLGDELTGTWKYTDSFTWDDADASGTVAIPTGVMTASRDASDSGN